jgi:hypothetical protein
VLTAFTEFGPSPAVAWAWTDLLLAVYFLGAAVVVFRLSWHGLQLARLLRQAHVVHWDGQRVVLLDDDVPPFSFLGLVFVRRPAEDGGGDALAHVIAHERTHVRQFHSLDIVLVQAATALQWFNPFVWAYREALRDVHEYLADRAVLAGGHDTATYARALLAQHFGGATLEFAHHFRHSQLRRRLDMMTRQSGSWSVWMYLLALPVLAVLMFTYAEPRAAAAGGSPMVLEGTLPDYAQEAARQTVADDAKAAEKKAAEIELKKKYTALLKEYDATTDPDRKKALGEKIAQFEQTHGIKTMKVDLSDPASVEGALGKMSAKMKALELKSRETTDPEVQAKITQELENLARKAQDLKARLAELQAGKPK